MWGALISVHEKKRNKKKNKRENHLSELVLGVYSQLNLWI